MSAPGAAGMAGTSAADDRALDPNRWAALVILLTGAFLAPLDFFIVNVAMPAISSGLGASADEIQLVMAGYAVVYAIFLITGGRLGDIYGRKAIFLLGLAGFAVASAFCGLAWSPMTLVFARLLQALTAAAMAPQALASVHALFPAHERGRALGIYGLTLGLASAVGQLLGGALVGANLGGLGWRLIFLVNLPIAILAFVAALPLLRETRAGGRPRLDLGGVALSCLALSALVVPLVEGRERGWPWWAILMLLSAPFFAEWFRRYEIRIAETGGDPLIAIEVFRSPGLLRGIGAILTLYTAAAFFLTYSIYLQSALGYTAFQAGLSILPFSAGLFIGSSFSPAIGNLLGRGTPAASFLISAAGFFWSSALVASSRAGVIPPWPLMAPALALTGLGMGLALPAMVRVIVERVAPERAGLVGGIANSALQVSAAAGVSGLGSLYYIVLGPQTSPAAISRAFALTLAAVGVCHLCGALLATGLGQQRRR